MQVAIIDDVDLSSEDIARLESAGSLLRYAGTPENEEELIARAKSADIIISGWTSYPKGIFQKLPNVRLISLWSTGTDYVNLEEAQNAGIEVRNVRNYAKNAVAELSFGLMLAVMRKIPQSYQNLKKTGANNWQLFGGRELTGKTLGILGTGAIGAKVAKIAGGFDMSVIAYDVRKNNELEESGLVRYVPFSEVLSASDIISLHMPLLPQTRNIISRKEFGQMKSGAVLINTARAELIDQEELLDSLKSGFLSGAGLDDLCLNDPSSAHLLNLDQVVATSHIGFYTEEAVDLKSKICVENVVTFIESEQ